jgi:hypothetical protein
MHAALSFAARSKWSSPRTCMWGKLLKLLRGTQPVISEIGCWAEGRAPVGGGCLWKEQGLLVVGGCRLRADEDVSKDQAGEGVQGDPLAHDRGQVAQPQQVPAAVCGGEAGSHSSHSAGRIPPMAVFFSPRLQSIRLNAPGLPIC